MLVFFAPFNTRYHNAPRDYFRYTHAGAMHVLSSAGFLVRDVHVIGSDEVTSAWLLGFGAGDLRPAQLADAAIVRPVDEHMVDQPPNHLFMAVGMLGRRSTEAFGTATGQHDQEHES